MQLRVRLCRVRDAIARVLGLLSSGVVPSGLLLGKLDKEGEGLLSDEVLGEIEDNVVAIGLVAEDMAELVEALGVWRKIEVSILDVTDDKGGKVKGIPLTLSELLLQHNGATKPAGRD